MCSSWSKFDRVQRENQKNYSEGKIGIISVNCAIRSLFNFPPTLIHKFQLFIMWFERWHHRLLDFWETFLHIFLGTFMSACRCELLTHCFCNVVNISNASYIVISTYVDESLIVNPASMFIVMLKLFFIYADD